MPMPVILLSGVIILAVLVRAALALVGGTRFHGPLGHG
jgi:hypothetical protein